MATSIYIEIYLHVDCNEQVSNKAAWPDLTTKQFTAWKAGTWLLLGTVRSRQQVWVPDNLFLTYSSRDTNLCIGSAPAKCDLIAPKRF